MQRSVIFTLCTILLVVHGEQKVKLKDLVTDFKRGTKQGTFNKETKFYSVLIESKLSDDYDDFMDEFNKAAQKYENEVKFMFMNTDVEENWEAIEYLGLIAEDVPAILYLILDRGLLKYKMPYDEITQANIEKFIKECKEGKAVSYAKSEDPAEDWDAKPVKTLVGKDFEEKVFVKGKTSFVFFYAPWCQACKNTMPEFEKLGLMYSLNKKIMIAKVDSTKNEVPQVPIFDVPSLALFIDGEVKPILYTDDDRTVKGFSAFIEKHVNEDGTKKEISKLKKTKTEKIQKTKKDSEAIKEDGKPTTTTKSKKKSVVLKDKEVDEKQKTKEKKEEVKEKKKDDKQKTKESALKESQKAKKVEEQKPKTVKAIKKDKQETEEKKPAAKKEKTTKETKKDSTKSKKATGKKAETKGSTKKKAKTDNKQKTEL